MVEIIPTPPEANPQVPPVTKQPINPQEMTNPKPKEEPLGSVTIESISNSPAVIEPKPDEQKPKGLNGNAKYIFILLGIVALIVIIAEALMVFSRRGTTKNTSSTKQQTQESKANNLDETDSDSDGIPDFVEIGINTNPNKDECKEQVGCDLDLKKPEKMQGNLLIILDSSGSMAEKISGVSKMDTAKIALKNYIDKIPEKVQIGLMVYGHKGNNTTSGKAISCAGIDLLYPISLPDKVTFKARVDSFSPTGWTPIADSLKQAQTAFLGKEGQNNRVLLISDGIETCDGKPTEAAAALKQAGIAVTIDVIGFAVDGAAKAQLQQVAQVSEGTYFEANTSEDFMKAFETSSANISSIAAQGSCIRQNYMEYNRCLTDFYMQALSYLNNQLSSSPQNSTRISDLIQRISKNFQEISSQSAEETQNSLDQNAAEYQEQINQQPTP